MPREFFKNILSCFTKFCLWVLTTKHFYCLWLFSFINSCKLFMLPCIIKIKIRKQLQYLKQWWGMWGCLSLEILIFHKCYFCWNVCNVNVIPQRWHNMLTDKLVIKLWVREELNVSGIHPMKIWLYNLSCNFSV